MKISVSPWVELEALEARHIAMSSELPPIPASLNEAGVGSRAPGMVTFSQDFLGEDTTYPLVNCYITVDNHHF